MSGYVVKPLDASTWDAFARLVERHNGVFGGCWCTWFHTFHAEKTFIADSNRARLQLCPSERHEELRDAQDRAVSSYRARATAFSEPPRPHVSGT